MPVAPTPRRILFRDPLREGTGRIHTIPVGATALRVVLARWPAQTSQCGLRVWRPLHVHLACWSRRTISQRLANRKVLALTAAATSGLCVDCLA
ncbi:hypothetical protein [Dictyobacter vulcani]|uniref:hypothetical protein n=1 Tax=Dictyobacter vulcani TaxID=2607529 RepID=UPI00124F9E18|nr:hypothetical protein [Dictyobacter vulcani]